MMRSFGKFFTYASVISFFNGLGDPQLILVPAASYANQYVFDQEKNRIDAQQVCFANLLLMKFAVVYTHSEVVIEIKNVNYFFYVLPKGNVT